MKNYNMLTVQTLGGSFMYFANGKRIPREEYERLTRAAKYHDSFYTEQVRHGFRHYSQLRA